MDTVGRIFELCKKKGVTLSVCESLTGGLVAARLIERAGASEFFYEGITAYSNDSKIKRLLVNPETLDKFGAVSYETAAEMAEGLYKSGSVGLTVSTTGIAGPSGGGVEKPVGLTYIGVFDGRQSKAYSFVFGGDRNEIREKAAKAALDIAAEALELM
ncbi:MAG: nicotinamide-nucleotide amidohydrolase family protein [Clostridiales bacterium]|jgi:nicotinamide-nucleotide amidase|nr:nicotinamide-nucleotide amidohydrolase family protein [Clostridiales bacterium]